MSDDLEAPGAGAAPSAPVPLIVKSLTGHIYRMMISLDSTVMDLKRAIQDENGIRPDTMIFVFQGNQLSSDFETLAACGVRGGDTVVLVLTLKGDIGVFVSALSLAPLPGPDGGFVSAVDAPGAAWLASASLPSPAPCAADVAAVVARVAPAGACARGGGVWESSGRVVGVEAAAALVALVDAAWLRAHGGGGGDARGGAPPPGGDACGAPPGGDGCCSALARQVAAGSTADDFKLLLTPAALHEVVGAAAFDEMLAALSPPPPGAGAAPREEDAELRREPDAVVLRRTTPTGMWIGFHSDDAARTVQVPLTGDADCEGGRLVFALPSGVLVPAARKVGALLAHDGDVVHGVTRLTRGMRYGLFLLRQRQPALPTPALVA